MSRPVSIALAAFGYGTSAFLFASALALIAGPNPTLGFRVTCDLLVLFSVLANLVGIWALAYLAGRAIGRKLAGV